MTKYLLSYHGGGAMPETEAETNEVMAAWGAWFESLGDAVVDGGNPIGSASSIAPDGSVSDGGQGLSGYSIISADSMDAAVDAAKGCPVLTNGGTVGVNEAIDM